MRPETITKETIEALQAGSHKAFEKVFSYYFGLIKTFIDRYIKSDSEAEELTEDLFVNLWHNRQSIDSSKSFNAYIHTIARNTAINFLKHRIVHTAYVNRHSVIEECYSSEDDFIAKETELLIEMAIEKMPERRKQVYLLSRKEGLSNEEIAQRLELSKTNVESQLSLALKDIRKAILSFLLLVP